MSRILWLLAIFCDVGSAAFMSLIKTKIEAQYACILCALHTAENVTILERKDRAVHVLKLGFAYKASCPLTLVQKLVALAQCILAYETSVRPEPYFSLATLLTSHTRH